MAAATETTRGILLRRTKLSETSLILTWLTDAHGLLKTVAKGARGPRSPFRGQLDLLYEADLTFVRSARSELHQLREVALRDTHEGIRLAFRRLELACYFVELIEITSVPDHPVPEAVDLMRRALRYLDTHDATRHALLHFERELAAGLGVLGGERDASGAIFRLAHRLPPGRADLLAALP
jgi:DNA repair protein RecO (recombination protein O)